jgi:hypothetical protein
LGKYSGEDISVWNAAADWESLHFAQCGEFGYEGEFSIVFVESKGNEAE